LSEFLFLRPLETRDDILISIFSILFIHGINGGSQSTWTKDGCMWPKDLLPAKIPEARILTFGYDAKFIRTTAGASLRDIAKNLLFELAVNRTQIEVNLSTQFCFCLRKTDKTLMKLFKDRPLVFVCHSLGGIVVKQVICSTRRHSYHYLGFYIFTTHICLTRLGALLLKGFSS
jgi:hypothetical protein